MTFRQLLMLSFVLSVTACNNQPTQDVRELHRQYMEATANFDLEKIRAMTADDFEWDLGGPIPADKEGALAIIARDAASKTRFLWENIVVRSDTVECDVVVSNEFLRALGTEQLRLFPRFVFRNSLLRRIDYWKPSQDFGKNQQRLSAFRKWTTENKSHLMAQLIDSEGKPILSEEAQSLMLSLAKEWQDAGQPGLE